MRCRRCLSNRLLKLDKKLPNDHDVFRCRECGFLFSPGPEDSALEGLSPLGPDSSGGTVEDCYNLSGGPSYQGRR